MIYTYLQVLKETEGSPACRFHGHSYGKRLCKKALKVEKISQKQKKKIREVQQFKVSSLASMKWSLSEVLLAEVILFVIRPCEFKYTLLPGNQMIESHCT